MVELPLIGWSPRDVDRESQCRLGAEPQVDDVEADEAHFCGADSEGPGDRLAYLVAGPPRSKLAAVLFDGADKLGKLRVAGVLTCGRAELGEEAVAALFPVDPRPAVLGLAERHPHGVAPAFGESVGPPDRGEGLVPRDEVEARIDDACWRRQQRVEEPSELASHAIGDLLGLGHGQVGEIAQMSVGFSVEAEGSGERVHDRGGRRDVPPLLEPRVPGEAHPRDVRHLLTAKPWRVAAPGLRAEPDVFGLEPCSLGSQVGAELGSAGGFGVGSLPHTWVIPSAWFVYY